MAVERSAASLLEENARLREALRPFAVMAPIYDRRPDGLRLISTAVGDVTVGDLRAAREAVGD